MNNSKKLNNLIYFFSSHSHIALLPLAFIGVPVIKNREIIVISPHRDVMLEIRLCDCACACAGWCCARRRAVWSARGDGRDTTIWLMVSSPVFSFLCFSFILSIKYANLIFLWCQPIQAKPPHRYRSNSGKDDSKRKSNTNGRFHQHRIPLSFHIISGDKSFA